MDNKTKILKEPLPDCTVKNGDVPDPKYKVGSPIFAPEERVYTFKEDVPELQYHDDNWICYVENMKTNSSIKGEGLNNDTDILYESYYAEMATIARDRENGILISVNPERKRLSIPYFKVYDDSSVDTAKRVIRLHFKDSGMEYHNDPLGKQMWMLNNKDIKNIRDLLLKPSKRDESYTYWQVTCFQWNYENGLIDDDIGEFFSGKYDHVYDTDERLKNAFVRSTTEIPDTWVYDDK